MERDEHYLTQRQAVQQYGINVKTLVRRRQDGRLPAFVDPANDRVILYRTTDLEALKEIRPARRDRLAEMSAA